MTSEVFAESKALQIVVFGDRAAYQGTLRQLASPASRWSAPTAGSEGILAGVWR